MIQIPNENSIYNNKKLTTIGLETSLAFIEDSRHALDNSVKANFLNWKLERLKLYLLFEAQLYSRVVLCTAVALIWPLLWSEECFQVGVRTLMLGDFGDGDNYDDGIGDFDNNEKTQNNIMTMLMVMEEVVGSEARLNPE